MDRYTINSVRTILEYEASIKRSLDESAVRDDVLHRVTLHDDLPTNMRERLQQYALKCCGYLEFGYDVDSCLSDSLPRYSPVEVSCRTPSLLQEIGFDNLSVIYTQKHLRDALAPKDPNHHRHGFTVEQIKQLPELLEHPVAVFDQPDREINGLPVAGRGVGVVLDLYDSDGIPAIANFYPSGYGAKTFVDDGNNVLASLYGRERFEEYVDLACKQGKVLYISSEKYDKMKEELPRLGRTQCPPALATLPKDIIVPSNYIRKMKSEIQPRISEQSHLQRNLSRTMHAKVADSRRNRLAQDKNKPRNINIGYDDDNRDFQ